MSISVAPSAFQVKMSLSTLTGMAGFCFCAQRDPSSMTTVNNIESYDTMRKKNYYLRMCHTNRSEHFQHGIVSLPRVFCSCLRPNLKHSEWS